VSSEQWAVSRRWSRLTGDRSSRCASAATPRGHADASEELSTVPVSVDDGPDACFSRIPTGGPGRGRAVDQIESERSMAASALLLLLHAVCCIHSISPRQTQLYPRSVLPSVGPLPRSGCTSPSTNYLTSLGAQPTSEFCKNLGSRNGFEGRAKLKRKLKALRSLLPACCCQQGLQTWEHGLAPSPLSTPAPYPRGTRQAANLELAGGNSSIKNTPRNVGLRSSAQDARPANMLMLVLWGLKLVQIHVPRRCSCQPNVSKGRCSRLDLPRLSVSPTSSV
jgi:hypothetical protein